MKIANALVSVADKNGLPELARELVRVGARIFATGGTARALAQGGVAVADLARITGDAEILDGRVKTLNTNLHAALLADPENPGHAAELQRRGIPPVQLVVANFYPFAQVAAGGASESDLVENIDIGGPAMVRAAAKGGKAVLASPAQYPAFVAALRESENGEIPAALVRKLFVQALVEVAKLDAAIANHFARGENVFLSLEKSADLRYGENPHQDAARYVVGNSAKPEGGGGGEWKSVSGGALSYNNILDAQAAFRTVSLFTEKPAAVAVKHTNPCGAATADSLCAAFGRARRGDPLSAFGGVVALNREMDSQTARAVAANFWEAVVAPGFSESARKIFAGKERPRLVIPPPPPLQDSDSREWRISSGLALAQSPDAMGGGGGDFSFPSRRRPDEGELGALIFAWKIAAALKSNAVALARGTMLVGAGAGQSSRVDASALALEKMRRAELRDDEKSAPLAAASDGFFPFADGARALLQAGATALAHPGGAKRDAEIVRAADDFGAALAVAGRRHFRH